MRFTFSRIMLIVSILASVGVAVAIVFGAGTQWETASPVVQVAPLPTPTELPVAEKEVAERAKQYLREHAAEYSLRPDLSDLQVSRVDVSFGTGLVGFRQLYQGVPVEKAGVTVIFYRDSKQPVEVVNNYNARIILQVTTPPYPGQAVASPSAKVLSKNKLVNFNLACDEGR